MISYISMFWRSLVFVCLGVVVCIEGFFLHLLSFQFVVFVHTFSHVLKTFVFVLVLNHYCLSLSLHLLSKESIFLSFEVFLHLLFYSLFFLFLKYLSSLILVHSFPVVGQYSVPAEHGLTSFLNV